MYHNIIDLQLVTDLSQIMTNCVRHAVYVFDNIMTNLAWQLVHISRHKYDKPKLAHSVRVLKYVKSCLAHCARILTASMTSLAWHLVRDFFFDKIMTSCAWHVLQ